MTRLDRRALFTSGAAAALLAASGLAPDSRPRRGGRLRLAVSRESDALARLVRASAFDTLTEVAPDGVLRGELATAWMGSSDARVWTFTLRDGVAFHNGERFGAGDVVASLAAHAPIADALAAIEATSPLEVRLALVSGDPHLPYRLADETLAICCCGAVDAPADSGVGTGLYAVRRSEPRRHFLGARVATHYKDGQAGWLDLIDAIVIPDAKVRAEALRDGFVDAAEMPAPAGLLGQGDFAYHPSADTILIAAGRTVGVPRQIGARAALDDGRIAERWWMT